MRRLVKASAAVCAVALTVVVPTGCGRSIHAADAKAPSPTALAPHQVVLPFEGLERATDVVVDAVGNVYVTELTPWGSDNATNHVVALPAGANAQRTLPFRRSSLSVDSAGSVWVVDGGNNALVKLAGDPEHPEKGAVLPMPELAARGQILTVDAEGNAYGTEGGGVDPGGACCLPVHVVKEAPGATVPEVLPFTHIDGLGGMAVDKAGNIYMGDFTTGRVLELAAGSNTPTELPRNGLTLVDLAVNAAGDVYAVDSQHDRVLLLKAGSARPTEVPFTGLRLPTSVAVGAEDDVYVLDSGNKRVVVLTGN